MNERIIRGMRSNQVVEMILHHAPLEASPSFVQNTSLPEWTSSVDIMLATSTKINISKGHSGQMAMPPEQLAIVPVAKRIPILPTIEIWRKRDKEFWKELWEGNGEEKFSNWCEFLTGGGYIITPQGGSGYRFELIKYGSLLDAIVFHDIHGPGGRKKFGTDSMGQEA